MYDADLAAFHDAHDSALAAQAATTLVDELADAGHVEGIVADLGCRSGVLAALVIEAGFDVLAVDPSPACLALVRRRAPRATRVQSHLADVVLAPGLVGITCVGEALSHDLRVDLDVTLESFHAALRPGGILVLDVPGPGRHGQDGVTVQDEHRDLLVMETAEAGFRLQRHITLFTAMTDGSYRRSDTDHELRLYTPEDIRESLTRAGFTAVREIERYGATGPLFGKGWAGFVAQRSVADRQE